jgi:Bacterial SH3 domain
VKRAVEETHAGATARLPMLDGFVGENLRLSAYERPYYQMRVEVSSQGVDRTLVHVTAKITAWYTDPNSGAQEYRDVPSNGRLESDLLDRIEASLKKTDADLDEKIASLQKRLNDTRSERQLLEKKRDELNAANRPLEAVAQAEMPFARLVTVKEANAAVYAQPSQASRILLRAEREDAFEILEERDRWLHVRLAQDATGWLPKAQTSSEGQVAPGGVTVSAVAQPVGAGVDSAFAETRENVTMFLGDWPGLKGKKALFVYTRPLGLASRPTLGREKLAYVKDTFSNRYRQAIHSNSAIAGVVVIFQGSRGGIAAARLDDIAQWVDGKLPDATFLKRCSLDPPELLGISK